MIGPTKSTPQLKKGRIGVTRSIGKSPISCNIERWFLREHQTQERKTWLIFRPRSGQYLWWIAARSAWRPVCNSRLCSHSIISLVNAWLVDNRIECFLEKNNEAYRRRPPTLSRPLSSRKGCNDNILLDGLKFSKSLKAAISSPKASICASLIKSNLPTSISSITNGPFWMLALSLPLPMNRKQ